MLLERWLVDGDYDSSPLFHPVDLFLVHITLRASLLSMAVQEVMKHNAIVEDAAFNLSTNDNLECRLALIVVVNKHVPFLLCRGCVPFLGETCRLFKTDEYDLYLYDDISECEENALE